MVIFSSTSRNYESSSATKGYLKIPVDPTTTYGKGAFISMTRKTWNNIQNQIKDSMVNTVSPSKLQIFLFDLYFRVVSGS